MEASVDPGWAIQQDRLLAGTTCECFSWWRPGNSLVRTDVGVETDMVESGAAVKRWCCVAKVGRDCALFVCARGAVLQLS